MLLSVDTRTREIEIETEEIEGNETKIETYELTETIAFVSRNTP